MSITLTAHARRRCAEMRVPPDEVALALLHPETTYPGPPRHGPNRLVCAAGRLAVVYAPDGTDRLTVITVLWRHALGRQRDGRPLSAA